MHRWNNHFNEEVYEPCRLKGIYKRKTFQFSMFCYEVWMFITWLLTD